MYYLPRLRPLIVAPLRTTAFARGSVSGGSWSLKYTVPAAHYAILKSLVMSNQSGSAGSLWVSLDGSTNILAHPLGARLSGSGDYEWTPWLALGPGAGIYLSVGGTITVEYALSGSLLYV